MTYSAQKMHACIGAAVVTCNAGLDARIIHQVGAHAVPAAATDASDTDDDDDKEVNGSNQLQSVCL